MPRKLRYFTFFTILSSPSFASTLWDLMNALSRFKRLLFFHVSYVFNVLKISLQRFFVPCIYGDMFCGSNCLLSLLRMTTCNTIFSARCNIYISRLCYDASVRLSIRLSVTEMYWRIIANLGFKFRSQFTAHCGRGACGREGRDHRREELRDHLALC